VQQNKVKVLIFSKKKRALGRSHWSIMQRVSRNSVLKVLYEGLMMIQYETCSYIIVMFSLQQSCTGVCIFFYFAWTLFHFQMSLKLLIISLSVFIYSVIVLTSKWQSVLKVALIFSTFSSVFTVNGQPYHS